MLDDYDANIVGLVPCLVEETVKEMFQAMMDLAPEDEIKKVKDYILKKGSATLLLIGADCTWYGTIKNQMQQNMAMGTKKVTQNQWMRL